MSESLLSLLDISPDALVVVNQEGTIVMVNGQAEALFGYAPEEFRGQQLDTLLPERFRTLHRAHREHYFSAPRTRHMGTGLQLFSKRKNGTEFPANISLRPLLLDEVLHVIATVRDLTWQKRIEEELRDQQNYTRSLIESNMDALMATEPRAFSTAGKRNTQPDRVEHGRVDGHRPPGNDYRCQLPDVRAHRAQPRGTAQHPL